MAESNDNPQSVLSLTSTSPAANLPRFATTPRGEAIIERTQEHQLEADAMAYKHARMQQTMSQLHEAASRQVEETMGVVTRPPSSQLSELGQQAMSEWNRWQARQYAQHMSNGLDSSFRSLNEIANRPVTPPAEPRKQHRGLLGFLTGD